jgi:acyl-CoA reductase-like NAD-dependent aldehyde dehydrogenase
VDPTAAPELFTEESFVCVVGETALVASTPDEFLSSAVDFVNERMWGTLSAAITVPQEFQRNQADELERAVDRLEYGTVGINQWPGVVFALMSTPWGAYPGSTLEDIQSGMGSVHNTYLLDGPEQTVISSPLTVFPKPVWFSTHRCPEAVADSLLKLYMRPTVWRLPPVLMHAIQG